MHHCHGHVKNMPENDSAPSAAVLVCPEPCKTSSWAVVNKSLPVGLVAVLTWLAFAFCLLLQLMMPSSLAVVLLYLLVQANLADARSHRPFTANAFSVVRNPVQSHRIAFDAAFRRAN